MERNGWRRLDRIDYLTSGWKGMDGGRVDRIDYLISGWKGMDGREWIGVELERSGKVSKDRNGAISTTLEITQYQEQLQRSLFTVL